MQRSMLGRRSLSKVVLLALPLVAIRLHAQAATGKIEGQLRDSAGLPLPDAQVYVLNTAYSALSDSRGHYFINNVLPGVVSIRAALIGFRPVEVRDLRVLAGQTITQDFSLEPQPLQLREITVLAAENLLVPRDEVTSKQRLSGEFSRELPQDRLDGLLALQPGVVASPVGLSIRGG